MTTETEIHINGLRAVELLRELVAETGDDFRYKRLPERGGQCVYAHGGEPSCGVGRALANAGVPLEALESLDTGFIGGTSIMSTQAEAVMLGHGVHLDLSAQELFATFQKEQDEGEAYATVMLEVEQRVRELGL